MSDRIAVMNGGKIQQIGTPEEIYENPCNRFVASFIGHTNLLDGEAEDAPQKGLVPVNCGGVRILARGASASKGQKLTVTLRYEKATVSASPDSDGHSIPCQVTERIYMGSAIRLKVRLASGIEMIADVGDVERVRGINIGDKAYLHIPDGAPVAVAN